MQGPASSTASAEPILRESCAETERPRADSARDPGSRGDYHRGMDEPEKRACLRVLCEVARADGRLRVDEKRIIDLFASHAYGDEEPPSSRFDGARDLARALAAIRTPEARGATWKACLALASVDGRCTKAEHAVLARVHAALAPDEPLAEVTLAEQAYDERLRAVERDVDEATTEFLHRVAQGSGAGAGWSQRSYEMLADELSAKKRELYARALSIPPPRG